MAIRFAERMQNLGTEGAFEVLAHAKQLEAQGRTIRHLEIGEPDFGTPDNIVEAAVSAINAGYTHYTPASGILEVREAVADFVTERRGIEVDARDVVLVPGTKNAIHFTLLACVEPGEEVIVPDPGYPAYESLARFVGGVPVPIRLREDRGFRMDLDELASLVTPRTRVLIINTPQNPTGGVLTAEDIEFIADLVRERDLVLISDEIYSQIVYGFEHVSPLAQPGMRERTVLIDGLSKAYAMCGWRLGFAVAPRELAQKMDALMINTSSCAAAFTQMATIEALQAPDSDRSVHTMVAEFQRRRDLVVEALNNIPGFRCVLPQGAFYAFPNITGTGLNEVELAHRLLDEAGVALLPGTAFGAGGAGFLRLAYTQSVDTLEAALTTIGEFVGGLVAA
jgi:aspartate/methionine/tyrosine aminotransferase